jgi:hypothetical protein
MKNYLLAILLLMGMQTFSQISPDQDILKLSNNVFKWEVENKIDSLEKIFNEKFVVIGSDGNLQSKDQYIKRLKSGSFVHDNIKVEENTAVVSNNTAVVSGKGIFSVTVSGKKIQLHLSYMEVFIRENENSIWQILAMKASVLDK